MAVTHTSPLDSLETMPAAELLIRSRSVSGSDALAAALACVGDRWSLAVVAQLVHGPRRFNDLAHAVAPIARTVLSERLRRLEDAGVVLRRQYSETPARHDYRLTVAGSELARVCGTLADWGSRHVLGGRSVLTHRGECGGDVAPAYRCDDCGPISAREVEAAL